MSISRTISPLLVTLSGALGLGALAPAEAATLASEVTAEAIYVGSVSLAPGDTGYLYTGSDSRGAHKLTGDPVLHVWEVGGQRGAASSDNYERFDGTESEGQASVDLHNTSREWVTYEVYVHAASEGRGGVTSVMWWASDDERITELAVGFEFEAWPRDAPCGEIYDAHAVRQPAGAADVMLLGLDRSGALISKDHDGGVAVDSQLADADEVCSVLVGTDRDAARGRVALYFNDYTNDRDGDGLGSELEAALGTCDDREEGWCRGVHKLIDTDLDGLTDADEVLGFVHEDDINRPQSFPYWGADPLHRDLFIELDYHQSLSGPGLTASDLRDLQDLFSDGSAASLGNPDGYPGLNLHVDVGADPMDPMDAALFGDWGGSDAVADSVAYTDGGTDSETDPYREGRSAARDQRFLHGLVTAGGSGQASSHVFYVADSMSIEGLAHELGHNLGLAHHGSDDWGKMNCKPNYPSLMNYGDTWGRFSLGEVTETLNPAHLDESYVQDADVRTGASSAPWSFDLIGDLIDWNHDGVISDVLLRAAPNWAPWSSCYTFTTGEETLIESELDTLQGSPDLEYAGDYLYAFSLDAGDLLVTYGAFDDSGADGSCPGGDSVDDTCTSWSTPGTVAEDLFTFSAASYGGGVAVATVNQDEEIAVLFGSPGSKGVISQWEEMSRHSLPMGDAGLELGLLPAGFTPIPDSERASDDTSDLELSIWSLWQEFDWEAALDRVFDSETRTLDVGLPTLALFYVDRTDDAYKYLWLGEDGWQGPATVRDEADQPVLGDAVAPAVTNASYPDASFTCGAFPDQQDPPRVQLHCLDTETGAWVDHSSAFPAPPETVGRPALAYHPYYTADGELLNDSHQGRLYMVTISAPNTDPDEEPIVHITGPALRLGELDFTFEHTGMWGNEWSDTVNQGGVSLLAGEGLSALKGLYLKEINDSDYDYLDPESYDGQDRLMFLPTADGTADEELSDGDDFTVMNPCHAVRYDSWCEAD